MISADDLNRVEEVVAVATYCKKDAAKKTLRNSALLGKEFPRLLVCAHYSYFL